MSIGEIYLADRGSFDKDFDTSNSLTKEARYDQSALPRNSPQDYHREIKNAFRGYKGSYPALPSVPTSIYRAAGKAIMQRQPHQYTSAQRELHNRKSRFTDPHQMFPQVKEMKKDESSSSPSTRLSPRQQGSSAVPSLAKPDYRTIFNSTL